jgi:hypothetical protein
MGEELQHQVRSPNRRFAAAVTVVLEWSHERNFGRACVICSQSVGQRF